jgi:hypothetical protein
MRRVLILSFLCAFGCLGAFAGNAAPPEEPVHFEVQVVRASDPGKPLMSLPPGLHRFRRFLGPTNFGTFADGGEQALKLRPGERGTAPAGEYTVEMTLVTAGRTRRTVEVTISTAGKPIGSPTRYTLIREPVQIQLGRSTAPTIIFLSPREREQRKGDEP